jgi:hypothetical protein
MSYERFTLTMLEQRFGLGLLEVSDLFAQVKGFPASPFLQTTLKRNLPLVMGKGTEKVRSELLIAPILVEVREILEQRIAVFSGVAFNVDKKLGLHGFCDFLISQNPLLLEIQAPVLMLAEAIPPEGASWNQEAKKEDLPSGVPQCLAEMIAAQRFNAARSQARDKIFGVVTSGTDWRFLQLEGTQATLDLREYTISEIEQILGILVWMVSRD